MSRQIKIRPGAPFQAALRATGGDDFPTGRVNAIAERYLTMIEEARPGFSRAEWLAIFDANNGAGSFDELAPGHMPEWMCLAANVADTIGLGDKWEVDQRALTRRLNNLPKAGKIAVLETVQRFWALCRLPDSEALDLATSDPRGWPSADG